MWAHLLVAAALGQAVPPGGGLNQPGAGLGGVYVDPQGVLRRREGSLEPRLRELREAAKKEKRAPELGYVSLPRLLAEARRLVEAGKPLPDEMRTLGGLVKLRYVFVFPEERDLVIAGPAEPIEAGFPGRPVGRRTGRPALQLDDLVVALRTCGPGREGTAFGCSIDADEAAQQRMSRKYEELKQVIRDQPRKRREAYDAIAAAAGPQPVRFVNLPDPTRLAFVCLEADYLLKRHSLGVDPSPVAQAPSVLKLVPRQMSVTDRSWFEALYEPLAVSEDGNAYEIRGQPLQVKSRRVVEGGADAEPHPICRDYAERLTKHWAALSEAVPAWADLSNLADLALLAALIGTDRLHERAGWDLAWILKDYPVAPVAVPTSVETMINFREASTYLVVVSGGVNLSMGEAVRRRQRAEPPARAERPAEGWSRTRASGP
jgi:hypothetical protein